MDVVEELKGVLPPETVITGGDIPDRNKSNLSQWTTPPRGPEAVVMARSAKDISTAMKVCHARGQRVVVQGGMTGLAAGAHPDASDIVISTEKLVGIEEIDEASGTMTVLSGTPLQVVQQKAEELGLLYGVDLGARGSCTIGGNVCTNAGGNQVLRYGMTRRNVLGLEAVLADGTIVTSLNKMMKNNTGYDLVQLMLGSEGTLGIITRVVVALQARPLGLVTTLIGVKDFAAALHLLRQAERAFPGGLQAFEGMWREYYEISTKVCGCAAPIANAHNLYLLVEFATGSEESGRDRVMEFLAAQQEAGLIEDAAISSSERERRAIWAIRDSNAMFHQKLPPAFTNGFDVSMPLSHTEETVARVRAALNKRWPDVQTIAFGHVADSNLHFIVRVPGAGSEVKAEMDGIVYRIVAEAKGSISAEHGIGLQKRPYLKLSRGPEEIAVMRAIKQALDPKGILNPGRIFESVATA